MSIVPEALERPVIIGRSSSHFTRITRIFAAEMRVDHGFRVVRDLMSTDPADYGHNPALKIPNLQTPRGTFFGALNVCRELWRLSGARARVVWPEDLEEPLLANAQELVLQAMTTEVSVIMFGLAGDVEREAPRAKARQALVNMMAWLEENAAPAIAALPPERDLSYLEVALFCLVTHLSFRSVLPTDGYASLNELCQRFGARACAVETGYRFDT